MIPWEADFLGLEHFLKSLKHPLTYHLFGDSFNTDIQHWKIKSFIKSFFFFLYAFQRCSTLLIKAVLQGCLNALTNCLFNKTGHIDQSLTSCGVVLLLPRALIGRFSVLSPVRCEAQWDHSCNNNTVGIIYLFKSINITENVPFTCLLDKIVGTF